jgi:hypothetical protein
MAEQCQYWNTSREAERQLYPDMRGRWKPLKAAQGGKVTVWQRVKFYAFGCPIYYGGVVRIELIILLLQRVLFAGGVSSKFRW